MGLPPNEPTLTPEARLLLEQEVSRVLAKERKRFIAYIGAVLAITFGVFGFSIKATSEKIVNDLLSSVAVSKIEHYTNDVVMQVDILKREMESIKSFDGSQLAEIIKQLESAPSLSSEKVIKVLTPKIAELSAEVAKLKKDAKDSSELLTAMGENPAKALALPILRKDLDSLSEKMDSNNSEIVKNLTELKARLTAETGRIYDLGKWFLGLILAASIVPIIEPLFTRKKQKGATKPSSEAVEEGIVAQAKNSENAHNNAINTDS